MHNFFFSLKYYFRGFAFFVLTSILSITISCKKEPRKKDLVYDYHDISITGADTIYSITFPDPLCGYAITNVGFYKTLNAGESWTAIDQTNEGFIQFHNRYYGVLPNGRMTIDGGLNWTQDAPYKFACMTEKGTVIALKMLSLDFSLMYETDPFDTIFHFIDTVAYYGINKTVDKVVSRIESHMGYIVIIPKEVSASDPFMGISHEGDRYFTLFKDWTHVERPVDICTGKYGYFHICGGDGYLGTVQLEVPETGYNFILYPDRDYFLHEFNYYSIDYFDDFQVAVGQHSIATNKEIKEEGMWYKELLNKEKEPFTETFYLLDIINRNTLVTAGTGGKIYYGTF